MADLYVIGVDLGQKRDYTASAVLQVHEGDPDHNEPKRYDLRHLDRPELGTSYTAICDGIASMVERIKADGGNVELVVDETGVGSPIVEMLRERKLSPVAITITSGDAVTEVRRGRHYRVPKRDLVMGLLRVFEDGRMRIAKGLSLAQVLRSEAENMRIKVNPQTAHDSYEHAREGDHDDLVLAACVAVWRMENRREPRIRDFGPAPVQTSAPKVWHWGKWP